MAMVMLAVGYFHLLALICPRGWRDSFAIWIATDEWASATQRLGCGRTAAYATGDESLGNDILNQLHEATEVRALSRAVKK